MLLTGLITLNPEAIMDCEYLRIVTSMVWGGIPKFEKFQYQCLQRYNITGIRETWWVETVPRVPHWMFRGTSGKAGEAGRWLECTEITFGNGMVLSLQVRIKGQINNMDVIVGIYY